MKKLIAKWGLDTAIVGGAGLAALLLTQNAMLVLLACVAATYFSEVIAAWVRPRLGL